MFSHFLTRSPAVKATLVYCGDDVCRLVAVRDGEEYGEEYDFTWSRGTRVGSYCIAYQNLERTADDSEVGDECHGDWVVRTMVSQLPPGKYSLVVRFAGKGCATVGKVQLVEVT
mmetsp:Transcript_13204/g.37487  ORF Transcript_13204/g.37487 Transcript_13204/m.37487 type:complete len:114 (-) Transcript_13204:40-381(-)